MVKSKEDVISEFNINTNMSVQELEAWLNNPASKEAGTGVGVESGHKIVEILKKNPDKDPKKYDEDDIEHMRKVVNYDKRHLAQEDRLKETKTREELENSKSTKSLRNWGHDPVKTLEERVEEGKEENGDEETSESVSPEDGPASSDLATKGSGGAKRKHEETDPEVDGGGDGSEEEEEVDEEAEGKGRARKKSRSKKKSTEKE